MNQFPPNRTLCRFPSPARKRRSPCQPRYRRGFDLECRPRINPRRSSRNEAEPRTQFLRIGSRRQGFECSGTDREVALRENLRRLKNERIENKCLFSHKINKLKSIIWIRRVLSSSQKPTHENRAGFVLVGRRRRNSCRSERRTLEGSWRDYSRRTVSIVTSSAKPSWLGTNRSIQVKSSVGGLSAEKPGEKGSDSIHRSVSNSGSQK